MVRGGGATSAAGGEGCRGARNFMLRERPINIGRSATIDAAVMFEQHKKVRPVFNPPWRGLNKASPWLQRH